MTSAAPFAGTAFGIATTTSEAAFQESVCDFARLNGWFVWSTRRSDLGRSDPGWPDLALARDGEFLLAELKTEAGRESEVQRASLGLLGLAVEVHVWRPSDWADIERRLRRKKGAKYPLSSRVHDVVAQQTAKTRTRKGRP